jgi:hypothetical protein
VRTVKEHKTALSRLNSEGAGLIVP